MSTSPFMDDYSSEEYSDSDHDDDYYFVPTAIQAQVEVQTQSNELQNLNIVQQEDVSQSVYFDVQPELEVETAEEEGGGVELSSYLAAESYFDLEAQVETGVGIALEAETVLEEGDVIESKSLETVEAETVVETVERMIEEFNFEAVESESDLEAEDAIEEPNSNVEHEADAVTPEVEIAVGEDDVIIEELPQIVAADAALNPATGVEEGDVIGESIYEAMESDTDCEAETEEEDMVEEEGDVVKEVQNTVVEEEDMVEEEDEMVEEEDNTVEEEDDFVEEEEDMVEEEEDVVEEEDNAVEEEDDFVEEEEDMVEEEEDVVEEEDNAVKEEDDFVEEEEDMVEEEEDVVEEDVVEEEYNTVEEEDDFVEEEEDMVKEEEDVVEEEYKAVEEEDDFAEEEHDVIDVPLESDNNPQAEVEALVEGATMEESIYEPLESSSDLQGEKPKSLAEPAVSIEMTTFKAQEPDSGLEPVEPEDLVDEQSDSCEEEWDSDVEESNLNEQEWDSDAREIDMDSSDSDPTEEEEDEVVVSYLNSSTTIQNKAWRNLVPASALAWAKLQVTDITALVANSSLLESFRGSGPMLMLQECGNAVMNVIGTLMCELSRIRNDLRRVLGALFRKRETTKHM